MPADPEVPPSPAAAWPDEAARAREPFAALDDLAFAEEFHRRHPAGAIVEDADELHRLVRSLHERQGEVHDLRHALIAAESKVALAGPVQAAAVRIADEVAIRRFLDDLAEAGLPSTLYQTFNADFRTYVGRRLAVIVETGNRLLGQFHDLPAAGIAARDARFAERDAAGEGGTVSTGEPDPFAGLQAMFEAEDARDPFDSDDEDDEERDDAAA